MATPVQIKDNRMIVRQAPSQRSVIKVTGKSSACEKPRRLPEKHQVKV